MENYYFFKDSDDWNKKRILKISRQLTMESLKKGYIVTGHDTPIWFRNIK